ncbi:hypothetical protein Sps_05112 [Shewanella psychrophila]|uniref:Uncharacterized protein n=1 Tax=Shewanella psychrophila TaxID=225848 RepID=A0A1S6HXG2_9GAMM|nr:hypothetical protein [Shewanella psychrophila]AQS40181.1 hypothetical protein Sps_05112 [Shewanella psychrophila]
MKRQPSYVNKRKTSRALDIFLGLSTTILVMTILVMALETWGTSEFFTRIFLNVEPLFWMDVSLWSLVVTSVVLFIILFWLTVAFSVLALASAICIVAALIMVFSGFSLLWPVLLLFLAAWGIGKSSQFD